MNPKADAWPGAAESPFTVAHFRARRERVLAELDGAVLLLGAAPELIRNNDVHHEYRQDSDLYYLTGFSEPESALLLGASAEQEATLFVRPRDPVREAWDGPRSGVEGATKIYGADAAFPYAELATHLPSLFRGHRRLYYHFGNHRALDEIVLEAIRAARAKAKRGGSWPVEIVDPCVLVHEHRVIKEPLELEVLRQSVKITELAHVEAMSRARPGVYEFQIDAWLRETFRKHGAARVAYAPIVGSGPNATILHYVDNRRRLEENDLVLIDAGAELHYYAADVTRTFPASGVFTPAQRRIYELVLEAELAGIAMVKPGRTFDEIHRAGLEVITGGLIDLGLIEGPIEAALEGKRYEKYFMHRSGHYLGMDVHDVGAYYHGDSARPLEAGMVLTVEPGVYISAGDAPPEYRGIGVRIEDDVLVTSDGSIVLSAAIPKTARDVEQACA